MATVDVRCESTLYGRLTDGRFIEVKCKRRRCGFVKGTILLHTIDLLAEPKPRVVSTKQFAEPKNRKEQGNAPDHTPAAVRTA